MLEVGAAEAAVMARVLGARVLGVTRNAPSRPQLGLLGELRPSSRTRVWDPRELQLLAVSSWLVRLLVGACLSLSPVAVQQIARVML